MISARRAAALGLTVPLSAIMNAVLGLWPEPEDDEPLSPQAYYGNGKRLPGPTPDPWQQRERAVPVEARKPELVDIEKVRRHYDELDEIREMQRARAEADKRDRLACEQAEAEALRAAEARATAKAEQTERAAEAQQVAAIAQAEAEAEAARLSAALQRRRENDALAALLIAELA